MSFVSLALNGFPAALEQFWELRDDLIRPGDEVAFSEKAAAWRTLTVKPDLPEKVKT